MPTTTQPHKWTCRELKSMQYSDVNGSSVSNNSQWGSGVIAEEQIKKTVIAEGKDTHNEIVFGRYDSTICTWASVGGIVCIRLTEVKGSPYSHHVWRKDMKSHSFLRNHCRVMAIKEDGINFPQELREWEVTLVHLYVGLSQHNGIFKRREKNGKRCW